MYCLQLIVEVVLRILAAEDFEPELMQSAGQTLIMTVQFRPKLFGKKGLVGPTLSSLMTILANAPVDAFEALYNLSGTQREEEDDDKSCDEEFRKQKMSQLIIDHMAVSIPPKYFLETALSLISQGFSSTNPQMRKAACAVLGTVAEGGSIHLKEHLPAILPALLHSFSDPEFFVRETACFALGMNYIMIIFKKTLF
jgi:importin-4